MNKYTITAAVLFTVFWPLLFVSFIWWCHYKDKKERNDYTKGEDKDGKDSR